MNREQFEGSWHQFKGRIKHAWGVLTDDDLNKINGKTENLTGLLQKKYGYTKQKANDEVKSFLKNLDKPK